MIVCSCLRCESWSSLWLIPFLVSLNDHIGFLMAIHLAAPCMQTKNTAFCPSITRVELSSALLSQPVFFCCSKPESSVFRPCWQKNILAFCSYYGGRAREFLVAYYLPGGPTDQNVEYELFSLKKLFSKKEKEPSYSSPYHLLILGLIPQVRISEFQVWERFQSFHWIQGTIPSPIARRDSIFRFLD